jgi:hypothetical protein
MGDVFDFVAYRDRRMRKEGTRFFADEYFTGLDQSRIHAMPSPRTMFHYILANRGLRVLMPREKRLIDSYLEGKGK